MRKGAQVAGGPHLVKQDQGKGGKLVLGVELERGLQAPAVMAAGCRPPSAPPDPTRAIPSPPAAQP